MPNEDKPCPGLQQANKVGGFDVGKDGILLVPDSEELGAKKRIHQRIIAEERSRHKGRIQLLRESRLKKKRS